MGNIDPLHQSNRDSADACVKVSNLGKIKTEYKRLLHKYDHDPICNPMIEDIFWIFREWNVYFHRFNP